MRAKQDGEENFFIIDGELNCEECSVQASFQKEAILFRQNKEVQDVSLPDKY